MIHDSSVGNADHEASDCTEVAVRHPKINDLSDSRATLRRRGPTAFVEPMIPSELLPAALRKLEPPQATPGRCQAAQNGIDLAQEDLISPLEATRHYPSGPMGPPKECPLVLDATIPQAHQSSWLGRTSAAF